MYCSQSIEKKPPVGPTDRSHACMADRFSVVYVYAADSTRASWLICMWSPIFNINDVHRLH